MDNIQKLANDIFKVAKTKKERFSIEVEYRDDNKKITRKWIADRIGWAMMKTYENPRREDDGILKTKVK